MVMKMKLIKVTPRGLCQGVANAINIAKKTRQQYPNEKITILGQLVHNQNITNALLSYNIETLNDPKKTRLELLEMINEGIVIFTAHGISEQVIEKAHQKGLICVNATCPYVSLIHNLIKEKLHEGYEIGYIGKKGHPESEAVLEMSPHIHLIENEHDLNFTHDRLFFTNQTTLSFLETSILYEKIHQKYPHAIISNDICNATKARQEALLNLEEVDVLIVVGDPSSHNTQKLAKTGETKAKKVYLIENLEQCLQLNLSHVESIAITSGASTPTKITQQIIQYLETNEITQIQISDLI